MGDEKDPPKSAKKVLLLTSLQCPMLTATNYTVWSMRMKVILRVHNVWETIDPGSHEAEKNDIATALLFQSIPENLILQVGYLDSPKGIWEAIKRRHLGATNRVKEARFQTLMLEFERLKMKDTDTVDIFAGKVSELASRAAALGQPLEEAKMVKKFLYGLPLNKYIYITSMLEEVLDLNKASFHDVVGRLKAYEERISVEGNQ